MPPREGLLVRGWIVVLGLALVVAIGACAGGDDRIRSAPARSIPAATPTTRSGRPATPRDHTFSLNAFRAEEVAAAWRFFDALNHGRAGEAAGLFGGRQPVVVDCDYRKEKPKSYHGLPAARAWLRHAIRDHVQVHVTRFWNESSDRVGSHGLGVDIRRRTDDTLAALGYPRGTKPPVGGGVAFTRTARIRAMELGYPRACHL